MTKLRERLMLEEGLRRQAYPDPLTGGAPWTIGYGHTGPEVHPGLVWTQAEAMEALDADIAKHAAALGKALPWLSTLDPVRRDVLVDMAFNMGVHGLLTFKNTLALIQEGKFQAAAVNMLKSQWASQVKGRALRLARIMSSGMDE
jgi:lysozyme